MRHLRLFVLPLGNISFDKGSGRAITVDAMSTTIHSPFTGQRTAVYHDVTRISADGIKIAHANGTKVYNIGFDYYIGDLATIRVMAADYGQSLFRLTDGNNLIAVKAKK